MSQCTRQMIATSAEGGGAARVAGELLRGCFHANPRSRSCRIAACVGPTVEGMTWDLDMSDGSRPSGVIV